MNVAGYYRKSNDEGDKNVKSVEVQQSVVTRFADARGWKIVASYVDDNITGAIYDRPALVQMLADAADKGRAFDVVVVSALDRVGRGKSPETIAVLDALEKAGVQVWSADDGQENTNVDNDETGMRELMRTFKLVAARTERLKTIGRVRNAARERFDKGFIVSGRTYGYDSKRLPGVKANAVMEINQEQAAIVRRVFQAVADGIGYTRIAKMLNKEGIPGPQRMSDAKIERLQREGRPVPVNHWQSTGIRELIFRDLYTGRQPYGQARRTGPRTRERLPREKWAWREVPHLRIVSDELRDAAHQRLAATTSAFLRRNGKIIGHPEVTKGKAMLSGFLVCGAPALSPREHGGEICGEPLIASSRGRNAEPVYLCRAVKAGKGPGYCGNTPAVPREELHIAVMAAMRTTFSAESFKAHSSRVANDTETRRRREAQRANLTADLPRLQSKAARLARLVADVEDDGELLRQYQEAKKAVTEARDSLAYLDSVERDAAAKTSDAAALEATWSDWMRQAEENPEVARQLLRRVLVSPIAVRPDPGKRAWTFAGFSRYDKVLAGGVAPGVATSVTRDAKTTAEMLGWLVAALKGDWTSATRFSTIDFNGEPAAPISGGSDAAVESGVSDVQVSSRPPCELGATSGPHETRARSTCGCRAWAAARLPPPSPRSA